MYRSFSIKNFRLFKDLRLDGLKRVNLIAGVNNVGKTALLEALYVHAAAPAIGALLAADRFRSPLLSLAGEVAEIVRPRWASLFVAFDEATEVELSATTSEGIARTVRLRVVTDPDLIRRIDMFGVTSLKVVGDHPIPAVYEPILELELDEGKEPARYYAVIDKEDVRVKPYHPPPTVPCIMLPAAMGLTAETVSRLFSRLEVRREEERVLEAAQVVDPRIKRLTVVMVGNTPLLHADLGSGPLIPLPLMGEGVTSVIGMVLAISSARDGMVLMDEIENGVHHSAMGEIWRMVRRLSEAYDVQVFATTHSFECILASHFAFEESEDYDFRLIRLERTDDGNIEPVCLSRESLGSAIEFDFEVR
ncbi:MAG: AAA family ATPase [Thermodesulfobacteriota bacterium]